MKLSTDREPSMKDLLRARSYYYYKDQRFKPDSEASKPMKL
jgi:hypothetical protein